MACNPPCNPGFMCPCPPPGKPACPSCMPVVCCTTTNPACPCPCIPGVPAATCNANCCPEGPCPRGFKPCTMTLTPPGNCDPRGMWHATIEKCPPKPKRY